MEFALLIQWLNSIQKATTCGLFLETSGLAGSVAVWNGQRLSFKHLEAGKGSAQTLAPAIVKVLAGAEQSVSQLQHISVTAGPGSFTGLRVGLATSRAFAFAAGLPLGGLSTLESLAYDFAIRVTGLVQPTIYSDSMAPLGANVNLVTALNAFRSELFVASWKICRGNSFNGPEVSRNTPDTRIVKKDLASFAEDAFAGAPYVIVSPEKTSFFAECTAGTLIQFSPTALGMIPIIARNPHKYLQQIPDEVLPVYHRGSAAEEKRMQTSRDGTS